MNIKTKNKLENESIKNSLPFLICINKKYSKKIIDSNYNIFKEIKEKTKISELKFELEIKIPDFNEKIIKIFDKCENKKNKVIELLLNDYKKIFLLNNKNFKINILIPERLISLFIGNRGNQIKNLINEFKVNIKVLKRIDGLYFRRVEISGEIDNFIYSCQEIFKFLEKINRKF